MLECRKANRSPSKVQHLVGLMYKMVNSLDSSPQPLSHPTCTIPHISIKRTPQHTHSPPRNRFLRGVSGKRGWKTGPENGDTGEWRPPFLAGFPDTHLQSTV